MQTVTVWPSYKYPVSQATREILRRLAFLSKIFTILSIENKEVESTYNQNSNGLDTLNDCTEGLETSNNTSQPVLNHSQQVLISISDILIIESYSSSVYYITLLSKSISYVIS